MCDSNTVLSRKIKVIITDIIVITVSRNVHFQYLLLLSEREKLQEGAAGEYK